VREKEKNQKKDQHSELENKIATYRNTTVFIDKAHKLDKGARGMVEIGLLSMDRDDGSVGTPKRDDCAVKGLHTSHQAYNLAHKLVGM
jgi:hypothetical protein